MPNGTVVPLPMPSEPGETAIVAPDSVGEAVVRAATMFGAALLEYADGGLTPAARMRGGDAIAALYMWHVKLGEGGFAAALRHEGKEAMLLAVGKELSERHGEAAAEAAIDEIVGMLAEIVGRVAAFEAEWARAPNGNGGPLHL